MFVLLIFYSLISGPHYFVKERGKLCNHNELIANLDECKLAVSELKTTGTNITFYSTLSFPDYPKGCFLIEDIGTSNTDDSAYWNTHVPKKYMCDNAEFESRPICKIKSM